MILMIDNFDSFTYNLVQYFFQLGAEVRVVRNHQLRITDVESMGPDGIVISPGPGRPEDAGISMEAVRHFSGKVPILGVCLGHQAIAAVFGARIIHAQRLMHGKVSTITSDGESLYTGIASPFKAMRYHSLAVDRETLPACLAISSEAEDGEIMGLRHREHPTEGLQFHPESIMTAVGKRLLRNYLKMVKEYAGNPV
jgi:anthranilate synthase/aminodeoxychorismate synthase-like glutamine amidotransferase